jgi:hypothetical protein
MLWIDNFSALRLEIVGIIALLGGESITRNAQVISLSWRSIIRRLMPGPHALLEHERKHYLPICTTGDTDALHAEASQTAPGIVAGAYSGLVKREINFFAQSLHPEPLDDYHIELCQVRRKEIKEGIKQTRSFGAKRHGP